MWICDCCNEINNDAKKECSYCGLKKTVRVKSREKRKRKRRSGTYGSAIAAISMLVIAVIALIIIIPVKNDHTESVESYGKTHTALSSDSQEPDNNASDSNEENVNSEGSALPTIDDSSYTAMIDAADINTLPEGKYSINVISSSPTENGTELLFHLRTIATFTDDYVSALSIGSEVTIDTMRLTVESFEDRYVYFDYGFLFRRDDGLWYACHPSDAGMYTLSETCYRALIPYSSITVVDNTLLKNEQLRDAYMLSDKYGEYDASVYIRDGEITHLEKEYRP